MCARDPYRIYQILSEINQITEYETIDCVRGGTRKPNLARHFNRPLSSMYEPISTRQSAMDAEQTPLSDII